MQMSFMDQTEPLWYERTQDMSGYIIPETISPLSDEQIQFFSTAQFANDIDVHNSENPSAEELIMRAPKIIEVSNQDSILYDISTNIKAGLPTIPSSEIDKLTKTNMTEDNSDFKTHIKTEIPPNLVETPRVEKKISGGVPKKSRFLSIFESEEPLIEEDLESQASCCTDNKIEFELRDDMEVAEEVIVTTEYIEDLESKQSPFLCTSDLTECPIINKEVDIIHKEADIMSSPIEDMPAMETPDNFNIQFDDEDEFFYDFDMSTSPTTQARRSPKSKLHLDLTSAMETSAQLLLGTLPDTPDVLKPVLNPGPGFDLLSYLLTNNNESNNNATMSFDSPPKPNVQKPEQRRGKNQVSLLELKESQMRSDIETEAIPGPSTVDFSQRTPRKSATMFKKRMRDVISSDNPDEEDLTPKIKQRKKLYSSNSRKRLNSDSDQSSICENALKYRERRDRNNLSSKRSRQKRKEQQELKKLELKELEEENQRLRRHADKLSKKLDRVKTVWKEYLKR